MWIKNRARLNAKCDPNKNDFHGIIVKWFYQTVISCAMVFFDIEHIMCLEVPCNL